MTTQTPATAEIEKWLRIRVCFLTNFLLRIRKKTWNPAGVDSGTPYPWPPLVTTGGCQGIFGWRHLGLRKIFKWQYTCFFNKLRKSLHL